MLRKFTQVSLFIFLVSFTCIIVCTPAENQIATIPSTYIASQTNKVEATSSITQGVVTATTYKVDREIRYCEKRTQALFKDDKSLTYCSPTSSESLNFKQLTTVLSKQYATEESLLPKKIQATQPSQKSNAHIHLDDTSICFTSSALPFEHNNSFQLYCLPIILDHTAYESLSAAIQKMINTMNITSFQKYVTSQKHDLHYDRKRMQTYTANILRNDDYLYPYGKSTTIYEEEITGVFYAVKSEGRPQPAGKSRRRVRHSEQIIFSPNLSSQQSKSTTTSNSSKYTTVSPQVSATKNINHQILTSTAVDSQHSEALTTSPQLLTNTVINSQLSKTITISSHAPKASAINLQSTVTITISARASKTINTSPLIPEKISLSIRINNLRKGFVNSLNAYIMPEYNKKVQDEQLQYLTAIIKGNKGQPDYIGAIVEQTTKFVTPFGYNNNTQESVYIPSIVLRYINKDKLETYLGSLFLNNNPRKLFYPEIPPFVRFLFVSLAERCYSILQPLFDSNILYDSTDILKNFNMTRLQRGYQMISDSITFYRLTRLNVFIKYEENEVIRARTITPATIISTLEGLTGTSTQATRETSSSSANSETELPVVSSETTSSAIPEKEKKEKEISCELFATKSRPFGLTMLSPNRYHYYQQNTVEVNCIDPADKEAVKEFTQSQNEKKRKEKIRQRKEIAVWILTFMYKSLIGDVVNILCYIVLFCVIYWRAWLGPNTTLWYFDISPYGFEL
ncbi:MAG: hypothetical protein EXX96DRAFT_538240 [Benjaminiella poitrasii]|nr:MAG: hypothetical protein EXX96DRAFT_538240 [Benjaminiella poitrasii]